MDISYLKSNAQRLIEHLKKDNYQKDAFWQTRRCINLVLTLGPTAEIMRKSSGMKSNEEVINQTNPDSKPSWFIWAT